MILQFGRHKGLDISSPEVPDRYILFLAKPKYSGGFYKSLHVTDLKWRVPHEVKVAARKEAERRGWSLSGETWSNDSQVIPAPPEREETMVNENFGYCPNNKEFNDLLENLKCKENLFKQSCPLEYMRYENKVY